MALRVPNGYVNLQKHDVEARAYHMLSRTGNFYLFLFFSSYIVCIFCFGFLLAFIYLLFLLFFCFVCFCLFFVLFLFRLFICLFLKNYNCHECSENVAGCSLNTVNNYRENVIHLCATNKCGRLIEMILRQHGTEKADSKNKFGWTPLMQALRERHLETAQLLINSGFHPSHRSYLGTQFISIS